MSASHAEDLSDLVRRIPVRPPVAVSLRRRPEAVPGWPRASAVVPVAHGLDLRWEMAGMLGLPAFGGSGGPLVAQPPELVAVARWLTRARAGRTRYLGGLYNARHDLVVVAGVQRGDQSDSRLSLLHELVHTFLHRTGYRGPPHGPRFATLLRRAFREAFPALDPPPVCHIARWQRLCSHVLGDLGVPPGAAWEHAKRVRAHVGLADQLWDGISWDRRFQARVDRWCIRRAERFVAEWRAHQRGAAELVSLLELVVSEGHLRVRA